VGGCAARRPRGVVRRGDIYVVDLDPTVGHELKKRRPVLIVSPTEFNHRNLPLVAPITSGGEAARLGLMAISLTGAGTQTTGVVLCNQIRTLDIKQRGGKRIERLPDVITGDVVARIADIYELCE
jgi:mRNA-degrading endonuclease toxin of MazEF toxin-antitoxin module